MTVDPRGARAFVGGERLTASNMMTFLMKQSVMTFYDATERTSEMEAAFTSPEEGMVSYLTSTDLLYVYSGTAWLPMATQAWVAANYDPRKSELLNYMNVID